MELFVEDLRSYKGTYFRELGFHHLTLNSSLFQYMYKTLSLTMPPAVRELYDKSNAGSLGLLTFLWGCWFVNGMDAWRISVGDEMCSLVIAMVEMEDHCVACNLCFRCMPWLSCTWFSNCLISRLWRVICRVALTWGRVWRSLSVILPQFPEHFA